MSSEYFNNLLTNETCRLKDLCSDWELFLEDNSISKECPDDSVGEILRVIGLTKLLLESKLPQFEKLVNSLANREYDKRIMTSEDLQGFWDLVSIQILDVDNKFASLNSLKNNNWIALKKDLVKPKKMNIRSMNVDAKLKFDNACLANAAKKRLALAKARMQRSMNTENQESIFPNNGNDSSNVDSIQCTKSPVKDCDVSGSRVTIC